jgi:hypothetical protein
MAPATRWTMRLEPYDPDARDADNDGIVQEQTPWERPAGTRLVDELGRAITRGANAGQRPRGLRVVDQRGNPVDYTPTYERPGFSFGGGGTPLGEAGAPSLRERGLPSVRDLTAPPPVPQTEPSLAPTLPPAAVLPGAPEPDAPKPLPEPEKPTSPATQEVKLSYVPGDVGDILEIQRQFEAQYSWVQDDMEGFVEYELSPEDLKRALEELDLPDKEALVTYLTDSAIARVGDYVDDVRQGPLYLAVTPQNLKKILEEKRFKSQFETGTSGGFFSPDTRRAIEDKYMGIPKDTPDELRPIYGFQLGEGEGDEVTRSGAAKGYGTIVVKLKDDVRGRTTMTAGDSLDHQLYGIPVDGEVTRERHLAAARRDYSQIWDLAKQGAMAEIVEDVLGGFYDWVEPYEDIIAAGASPHYNEIQVHGGLTLDNVEEVIYPSDWTQQELLNPTWSDVDYQVAADARKAIIALLDEANIKHGEDW